MKLIINRAKWLRGEGGGDSYLLRHRDGKMCCLGFYGISCGLLPQQLRSQATPWTSREDGATLWPDWMFRKAGHIPEVLDLFEANDSEHLSEVEREQKIASIFAALGIEVEFVEDALKAPPASMSVHDPAENLEVIP